jgi:hypothetical protein
MSNTAKKATPKPLKAVAKKAAPKEKVAPKSAPKPKAAKTAPAKEDDTAKRDAEIAEVGKLRSEGLKWPEVADALGFSVGKAQLLGKMAEFIAAGNTIKRGTPALVRKDRDERKMGWDDIGIQYGLNKGQTQKLYAESGADPHKSYVGRGGRYFSHESDIAPLRAAKKEATPKAAKAPKVAAPAKSLFAEDAETDAIKAKIDGKTVTVQTTLKGATSVSEVAVKPGTVKVGKQKDGTRVVQFTETGTGGTRTVRLSSITKVSKS